MFVYMCIYDLGSELVVRSSATPPINGKNAHGTTGSNTVTNKYQPSVYIHIYIHTYCLYGLGRRRSPDCQPLGVRSHSDAYRPIVLIQSREAAMATPAA